MTDETATPLDLDAIRADVAAVQLLTFGRPEADRLATEHAPALITEVERLRAATVKPDREAVARAIFDADFPDIAEAERDAEWGIIASADHVSVWHRQADAVLDLLPGRSEAGVSQWRIEIDGVVVGAIAGLRTNPDLDASDEYSYDLDRVRIAADELYGVRYLDRKTAVEIASRIVAALDSPSPLPVDVASAHADVLLELANGGDATSPPARLGWWAISGTDLLDSLRRAASGEDPDLIYAEAYANADHERIEGP